MTSFKSVPVAHIPRPAVAIPTRKNNKLAALNATRLRPPEKNLCAKVGEVQTADQNFTHPRFHRERSFQVSMRLGVTPGVVNASSSVIASSCISRPSMNKGGKVYVNFMRLEDAKEHHQKNMCYLENADGGNKSRKGTDSGDPGANHKRYSPVCAKPPIINK
jgi:hypothetical protein